MWFATFGFDGFAVATGSDSPKETRRGSDTPDTLYFRGEHPVSLGPPIPVKPYQGALLFVWAWVRGRKDTFWGRTWRRNTSPKICECISQAQ